MSIRATKIAILVFAILLLIPAIILGSVLIYNHEFSFERTYEGIWLTDPSEDFTAEGKLTLSGTRSFADGFRGSMKLERNGEVVFENADVTITYPQNTRESLVAQFGEWDPLPTAISMVRTNGSWSELSMTMYMKEVMQEGETLFGYFCAPAKDRESAIKIIERLK